MKVEIDLSEDELVFIQKQAAKHELSVNNEIKIRMGFSAQEE